MYIQWTIHCTKQILLITKKTLSSMNKIKTTTSIILAMLTTLFVACTPSTPLEEIQLGESEYSVSDIINLPKSLFKGCSNINANSNQKSSYVEIKSKASRYPKEFRSPENKEYNLDIKLVLKENRAWVEYINKNGKESHFKTEEEQKEATHSLIALMESNGIKPTLKKEIAKSEQGIISEIKNAKDIWNREVQRTSQEFEKANRQIQQGIRDSAKYYNASKEIGREMQNTAREIEREMQKVQQELNSIQF